MESKLYIKQDKASEKAVVACRLLTDDDPQIQLIPGEWVKVASCQPGKHALRIGAVLTQGKQKVKLSLDGGTFNGRVTIVDNVHAPTDGNLFMIEVA